MNCSIKRSPSYKGYLFTFFLVHFFCLPLLAASSDWLPNALALLSKEMMFSTTFKEEVQAQEEIISESEIIIGQSLQTPAVLSSQLIDCIRVLYVQGNHYLYADRPFLAQTKLLTAKNLCEKHLTDTDSSIVQTCLELKAVDPKLPSLYALTLYLLAKSYLYPKTMRSDEHYLLGEAYLLKAIALNEYIDTYPQQFDDTLDNNPAFNNTCLFKRLLGHLYYEKEQFQQAENTFLAVKRSPDSLNQLICLKYLIQISQKKAQVVCIEAEKKRLYAQAGEYLDEMLLLLESFSNLYRLSFYYSIAGYFYVDSSNPFKDSERARSLFLLAQQVCPAPLSFLQMFAHQGLAQAYLQLAEQAQTSHSLNRECYIETNCSDCLKDTSYHQTKHHLLAYEEMGDIYQEKADCLTSTALYSNALYLYPSSSQRDILTKKMLSNETQYFSSFISYKEYQSLLKGYRLYLKQMRKEVKQRIDNRLESTESLYLYISSQYRGLLKQMLEDILIKIEKPPQEFALICGGSIGRNVASPYSDAELAFLISDQTTQDERLYFKRLANLLCARLIAIGETPISYLKIPSLQWLTLEKSPAPRGLMLDPAQLVPLNFPIATPSELAYDVYQNTPSKRPFLYYSPVTGHKELVAEYELQLEKIFPLMQRQALTALMVKQDLLRWSLKSYKTLEGTRYSLKHDLYRPLDTFLYHLGFYYWIRDVHSYWELIRKLDQHSLLPSNLASRLADVFDQLSIVRLEAYLAASQQQEWLTSTPARSPMSYLVDSQFIKSSQDSIEDLQHFVSHLFIYQKLDPSSSYTLDSLFMQAKNMQETFGNFHPATAESFYQFGLALNLIGHVYEAASYLEKAIKSNTVFYGTHHPCLIEYYRQLGIALVYMQEPLKAYQQFKTAYEIALNEAQAIDATDLYDQFWMQYASSLSPMTSIKVDQCHLNCQEELLACEYRYNHHLLSKARLYRKKAYKAFLAGHFSEAKRLFHLSQLFCLLFNQ